MMMMCAMVSWFHTNLDFIFFNIFHYYRYTYVVMVAVLSRFVIARFKKNSLNTVNRAAVLSVLKKTRLRNITDGQDVDI